MYVSYVDNSLSMLLSMYLYMNVTLNRNVNSFFLDKNRDCMSSTSNGFEKMSAGRGKCANWNINCLLEDLSCKNYEHFIN